MYKISTRSDLRLEFKDENIHLRHFPWSSWNLRMNDFLRKRHFLFFFYGGDSLLICSFFYMPIFPFCSSHVYSDVIMLLCRGWWAAVAEIVMAWWTAKGWQAIMSLRLCWKPGATRRLFDNASGSSWTVVKSGGWKFRGKTGGRKDWMCKEWQLIEERQGRRILAGSK